MNLAVNSNSWSYKADEKSFRGRINSKGAIGLQCPLLAALGPIKRASNTPMDGISPVTGFYATQFSKEREL